MISSMQRISIQFFLMILLLLAACTKQGQKASRGHKVKVVRRSVDSTDRHDRFAYADIDGWKDKKRLRENHKKAIARNLTGLVFSDAQEKAAHAIYGQHAAFEE